MKRRRRAGTTLNGHADGQDSARRGGSTVGAEAGLAALGPQASPSASRGSPGRLPGRGVRPEIGPLNAHLYPPRVCTCGYRASNSTPAAAGTFRLRIIYTVPTPKSSGYYNNNHRIIIRNTNSETGGGGGHTTRNLLKYRFGPGGHNNIILTRY